MDLQQWTFPETGSQIRSVVIDEEPWFVGRDVALLLGYSNLTRDVSRHTTDRQRRQYRIGTPSGEQVAVLINEAGVYRLMMRSNLPAAEQFQNWLAEEVLPALRRTGRYEATPAVPQTLPEALRAYAAEVESREAAEQRAAELEPAAGAWTDLAEASGDHAVREAAQILSRVPGISVGQNGLFAKLRDLGWIDKTGQPYQAQVTLGRLVRRTTSYTHPHTLEPMLSAQVRITAKGLSALREALAADAQLTLDGGIR